ncbi:hypothetical protein BGZ80_002352, partial [Entomortierella chlamydospora]
LQQDHSIDQNLNSYFQNPGSCRETFVTAVTQAEPLEQSIAHGSDHKTFLNTRQITTYSNLSSTFDPPTLQTSKHFSPLCNHRDLDIFSELELGLELEEDNSHLLSASRSHIPAHHPVHPLSFQHHYDHLQLYQQDIDIPNVLTYSTPASELPSLHYLSSFQNTNPCVIHASPLLSPTFEQQPTTQFVEETLNIPNQSLSSRSTASHIDYNCNYPYNNMNNTTMLTSAATLMAPPAGLSFSVQSQQNPAQSMDGIDATLAAFHDLGLDLPQAYGVNPKQENLSSPIYSPISNSSCTSPTTGDLLREQSAAFQTHVSQGYQHEDRKAFDTLNLFTEQELNLDLGNPAVSQSSVTPTPVSFKVEDRSDRNTSTEFEHYPNTLVMDTNTDANPNVDAGLSTSVMTESQSSSKDSTPTSSTPPSPSPPSYDDSMIPVVACASCKRSHIKCDHSRPCQNCRKNPTKAENCRDAVPKPRGRPKGVNKVATSDVHPGFRVANGNPYQYIHDQPEPEQPQFHRQRALSFPHSSSFQEPSPYVLQSQQHHLQPPPLQPHQPQQYPFHHHHHHHYHGHSHQHQQQQQQQQLLLQQQQQQHLNQYHQREIAHTQVRIPPHESRASMPSSTVDFHRQSSGYPSAPYHWSNGDAPPGIPDLKSMYPRRQTVTSSTMLDVHARPSQPIPVQAPPHASNRYFSSSPHAVQTGPMFASLPSHFSSPTRNSPPPLDAYQLHQLQQHRQKLYQQQQLELLQKRNSHSQVQHQIHPHPVMQNHSFFS